MGCCFSFPSFTTTTTSPSSPTAIVIALDGSLTEHSVPVTVSKVLGIDRLTCFLCNSDSLSFDTCIPSLHSNDPLIQDQIYFVLQKSKVGVALTGADMAALAVKASSALSLASQKKGRKRRKVGVVPVVVEEGDVGKGERGGGDATTIRPMMSRQRSLGMNASSWAKALRRSLRRTLSMIEEGDEQEIYLIRSDID